MKWLGWRGFLLDYFLTYIRPKMVIIRDADGDEEDASANRPLRRRNSKRSVVRDPCPARNVEDDDVDHYRVVKRRKCATSASSSAVEATGAGADASYSAVVAEDSGGEAVHGVAAENLERPSQAGRIRASPGRFAKLNKSLFSLQKSDICSRLFGGILNLAKTLPADLVKFLVGCYKPESYEMVFPGRGRIRVDADSVHRVFNLSNRGQKVNYVVDKDATRRFFQRFNITDNSHPKLDSWIKTIAAMNGQVDDTFFIAWLAMAFTTFLAPTTGLKLSPKCYGLVLDHEMLKNTNICLFVAEHINEAFRNMG